MAGIANVAADRLFDRHTALAGAARGRRKAGPMEAAAARARAICHFDLDAMGISTR
ncbi:Hypothetical protein A7982_08052 [Minicystis rosea]|nr:Hypothetical protein A7982_08052 [Minicystis rosea]